MATSVEEEKQRKRTRPLVSEPEAKTLLASLYGLPGDGNKVTLTPLPSYDDLNFKVQVEKGNNVVEVYTLKVFNGVDSQNLGYIDGIQKAALHVQKAGVSCAVPIPAIDGKTNTLMKLPTVGAGEMSLAVSLMTWIEGKTMSDCGNEVTPGLLVKCGEFLGTMDAALALFDCAALTRVMQWDLACTADLEQFLEYLKDDEQRSVVESVISAFKEEVLPCADQLRSSIIHGDFNDGNIIISSSSSSKGGGGGGSSSSEAEIAGVVDFGDACRTWAINEVAISMAYAMVSMYAQRTGDYLGSAALILRGYVEQCPLPAGESKHLRTLVASRLAMSMTLGAYSSAQQPDNAYLLVHAKPCWQALKALWCDVPEVHAKALWEKAIMKVPPEVLLRVSVSMWRGDKRKDRGPLDVTFVTGNVNKLKEVQQIMGEGLPFNLSNQKVDLPELQGEAEVVAKEKCKLASQQIAGPVIVEDTGLCFVKLGGLPGPYIKWFLDKTGHDGLNNLLAAHEDKSAYAQCIFAFCPGPGRDVVLFEGRTMGKIVPARGPLDFGWDPVFEPDEGGGKTFAEMSKEDKNAISHRGRALEKLKTYLIEFANEWS